MGPCVFLSGPDASGLETQVLGPHPNEALSQAGGEAIQVARTAYVQGPLWRQRKFFRRDGFCRYYHLVVENIQIRWVAVFTLFSMKGIGKHWTRRSAAFKKTTLVHTLAPSCTVVDHSVNTLRIGSKGLASFVWQPIKRILSCILILLSYLPFPLFLVPFPPLLHMLVFLHPGLAIHSFADLIALVFTRVCLILQAVSLRRLPFALWYSVLITANHAHFWRTPLFFF